VIVLYDPELLDWNEVLEKAWASRPPGEVGMIVAIPKGGRMHRELMKQHGGPHHGE
jgi:hypothetical protein